MSVTSVPPVGSRSVRLDKVLADLLAQAPELQAAAVVSFDGLPMASALPPGMDEDRVAAMSAALLSLGERAAQGLGRGDLSQVYVEGHEGTVFLVSAEDEAVLVAVAVKGAKVGLMMFEVRRAAAALADALRADDAASVVSPTPPPPAAPAPSTVTTEHADLVAAAVAAATSTAVMVPSVDPTDPTIPVDEADPTDPAGAPVEEWTQAESEVGPAAPSAWSPYSGSSWS